jgi:hypothetical protein
MRWRAEAFLLLGRFGILDMVQGRFGMSERRWWGLFGFGHWSDHDRNWDRIRDVGIELTVKWLRRGI